MPKGVMVVQSRPVDPSREDEFNEWYDAVHVPEICAVPGFVGARRYRVRTTGTVPAEPGVREYLAVYEIEADDLDAPMAEYRARSAAGQTHRSSSVQSDPPPIVTIYELLE